LDIRKLTDTVSVAAQITAEQVTEIASMGFRHLINNRPDHEVAEQPLSADIQAAAKEAGLEYHFLPVISNALTLNDVARTQELLDDADGPTLMFCRSGTRCTTLWAFSRI